MTVQALTSCRASVVFVGIALWMAVGLTLAGLNTFSYKPQLFQVGHGCGFFQAYAWLSGQQPGSLIETSAVEVTTGYWLGITSSLVGLIAFFGSKLTVFNGRKTLVFWLGLIILGLASVALFTALWYPMVVAQPYGGIDYYWKFLVPPMVGSIVFILIGLYMMKSGTKKEEGKTQLLNQ